MSTESTQAATMTVSELLGKLDTTKLTANHYKLIITAMLGDMLEFFDYWIIGFILAFIVKGGIKGDHWGGGKGNR
ncbi:MAG: hypothetical protein ABSD88_14635 [Candidatus Korobacteraceae bacterium]|jgi:hypothetical protein